MKKSGMGILKFSKYPKYCELLEPWIQPDAHLCSLQLAWCTRFFGCTEHTVETPLNMDKDGPDSDKGGKICNIGKRMAVLGHLHGCGRNARIGPKEAWIL
ncbi:hypothetical protein TWF506_003930 [Arthrobotrys conoides]|uniref:Uncharacterized protein n=1 Tax=Arthrobotrys conoides TaxID=74498 RepID=A0AAN8NKH6_9PEZI